MLGLPAAAVAGKRYLAQKQTLVAKKRTLVSKLTDLTPGSAFLPPGSAFVPPGSAFVPSNFFLQLLQQENQALFCKNILRGYLS